LRYGGKESDMSKTTIIKPEEIVAYYNENIAWKGHFDVVMPDGSTDDYDTAIPDFTVKQKYGEHPECLDSNGSSPNECILINGVATFVLEVADREYEVASTIEQAKLVSFREMEILCTIKEIRTSEEDGDSVVIESVQVLSLNGVKE
jgi:hypothetical protein